ncbi:DNA-binding protein [Acidipila sp. EB88]|nr:helix-turn-helix domain-containing protein [Acidipila sp. EB88]RRA50303.1 DNA-binding protein [Acidipila sp. EB88]
MDIRQAADYLGISADSLYRYAAEATIPAFRLGNRWRFKKSKLDSWMEEQSDPVPTMAAGKKKPARSVQKPPLRAVR